MLSARQAEINAVLDSAMRAILAEVLDADAPPSSKFDKPDGTSERWRIAEEIDRARIELAALRERVAIARRELDEVERRKAEAEEEYRTLRQRIEAERADLLPGSDRIASDSKTESSTSDATIATRPDSSGTPDDPPEASVASTEGHHETTLVVNNLPNLAEALRVRKALRTLPAVHSVSFPRFQNGTMTIIVEHAPSLDLIAAFRSLPEAGDIAAQVS